MKKADDTKPLVYFAAPLFSEAELAYNLKIAKLFEAPLNVFLPQRDGDLIIFVSENPCRDMLIV